MKPAEKFFMDLVDRGLLTVSTDGVVINTRTGNSLGSFSKARKIRTASLKGPDGRIMNIQVHRLMWMVHRGPIPPNVSIVPLDLNIQNLNLSNFAAVNSKEYSVKNLQRGNVNRDKHNNALAKLTVEIVAQARREYRAGDSCVQIARKYGVSKVTMLFALKGQTWPNCTEEPPIEAMRKYGKGANEFTVKPARAPAVKKVKTVKEAKQKAVPVRVKNMIAVAEQVAITNSMRRFPKTVETIKRLLTKGFKEQQILTAILDKGAAMPTHEIERAIRLHKKWMKADA